MTFSCITKTATKAWVLRRLDGHHLPKRLRRGMKKVSGVAATSTGSVSYRMAVFR